MPSHDHLYQRQIASMRQPQERPDWTQMQDKKPYEADRAASLRGSDYLGRAADKADETPGAADQAAMFRAWSDAIRRFVEAAPVAQPDHATNSQHEDSMTAQPEKPAGFDTNDYSEAVLPQPEQPTYTGAVTLDEKRQLEQQRRVSDTPQRSTCDCKPNMSGYVDTHDVACRVRSHRAKRAERYGAERNTVEVETLHGVNPDSVHGLTTEFAEGAEAHSETFERGWRMGRAERESGRPLNTTTNLAEPQGRPGASDRVLIAYHDDDTRLVCGCHFYREGTDATEPEHENDIMVWPCGRHLAMFGMEASDDV